MRIEGAGIAGTMESGDILVEIEQMDTPGVEIDLDSTVGNQYGKQIREVITQTVGACGMDGVRVKAIDKGALDCTIRARVTAAAHRAKKCGEYHWV